MESHLLAQPGVQLLSPKHPASEREHFLVSLRPGLPLRRKGAPLRLQGLQGTLERRLGIRQGLPEHRLGLRLAGLRHLKPSLNSLPLD